MSHILALSCLAEGPVGDSGKVASNHITARVSASALVALVCREAEAFLSSYYIGGKSSLGRPKVRRASNEAWGKYLFWEYQGGRKVLLCEMRKVLRQLGVIRCHVCVGK
ncbi:hypothetical protein U1Q18_024490 [Sarracenia purpurea var. burkii]